jgi:hypothetical protein
VSEYLDLVDEQLETGTASAQALVLHFRAGEEAEERGDIAELERTLALAKRIVRTSEEALAGEAERLVALCEERLERTRAAEPLAAAFPTVATSCPDCGRPISASAVRCRACGTLPFSSSSRPSVDHGAPGSARRAFTASGHER